MENAVLKAGETQVHLQETKQQLDTVMYILIAWAVLITIAIAIMAAVVGVRVIMLRKRARRLGPRSLAPKSQCSVSFDDTCSVIDFDRIEKKKKAAAAAAEKKKVNEKAKATPTHGGSSEWQPRQRSSAKTTTTTPSQPAPGSITIPDPGSSTY